MNRLKIAQYIAVGATIVAVGGLALTLATNFADVSAVILLIGVAAGIVAYLFGGLGTALKMAWGIAKLSFIIPLPYGLFLFPVTLIVALFVLLFIPIVPIRKAYTESLAYQLEQQ